MLNQHLKPMVHIEKTTLIHHDALRSEYQRYRHDLPKNQ
jgi:hypothetical protein